MFEGKKKWVITIAVLLIGTIILSGCGLNTALKKQEKMTRLTPVDGGVFRFGMISSPSALEPAFLEEINGIEICKELNDGLIRYDPNTLEIKPAIAESWDYSEDKKVITFHIRKDVKFHDGTILKAQDIIDVWNRLAAKDTLSPLAFLLEPIVGFAQVNSGELETISGLKTTDDYTLEVTLKEKNAVFLTSLGHPAVSIYKLEAAKKAGKDFGTPAARPETLIGTGAFKFVKWNADQDIILEKFPDYYGTKAHVDKIIYKIFKDESTAFNEFRAGNLDYVDMVPPGQRQSILKEIPDQILETTTLTTQYIGFNLTKDPFKDNINIRKAIACALDIQSIADTVLEGSSTVSNGPLPDTMPGYNIDLKAPTFDKKKAKEYLALAGYPDGQGLGPIQYAYNYTQENQRVAEAFQAQLKEVGIQIHLKNMEWGSYINAMQSGELQMFRVACVADYPDPDNLLRMLYSKSQWGMNNVTFYSNPEVEGLLTQGLEETDITKRMEIYKKIQELIVEDQPAIWTFSTNYLRIYGDKVHNLKINALDQKDMRSVWLS
ncbi:peptide ABC transporter substrate-binding protein [Desulfosporosinus sp. HMP52]|uniref:ABC transporter substrate-binding protein n=1 Tax=Desulfosporosinus sp. HMP52 TaxID=1487923 RepID=UPI00051FF336|nr:ABC transporter substrate-binding protein [Desulfosporosinus sp. HMP52]KGK89742.1 peptide ABC transporter substrate-binding protein [Desulfosporosinus sp. HMP52]